MEVLYLPLDERPCNYGFPNMLANTSNEINIISPSKDLLGDKKKPADTEILWLWMENEIKACDAAIISVEMAVYGGLLPSRLHWMDSDTCCLKLDRLRKLKASKPELKVYLSNLIMRTPTYNSSEEEPEYYEKYGSMIFRYGWLQDKKNRESLIKTEEEELQNLCTAIPTEILQDYSNRRETNLKVTMEVIQLVKEGIVEFLSIPQDDSATYGFTAIDQKIVMQGIEKNALQRRIHTYPGADEVGCTLLARVYTEIMGINPLIYVYYSSSKGMEIIPNYEDRPLGESVKSHIIAAGASMADSIQEADLVLMVNSPGQFMQEASEQWAKDVTYSSYRNLREFVDRLSRYTKIGKKCIIADVAFSNGGDSELISLLAEKKLLNKIDGYAGWNTACNTLGTVIATGIVGLANPHYNARIHNTIYRLLEDWGYQALVRQQVIKDILPGLSASYYDFHGKGDVIHKVMRDKLMELWNEELKGNFSECNIQIDSLYTPWHRMFEIEFTLEMEWVG